MTILEAKEKFIRSRKLQGMTNKTIVNYEDVLGRFIRFIGDKDVIDLSIGDIEDYQEYLIGQKLANASVANYLRHIKAFINYLIEYGILSEEFKINRIKLPKPAKRLVDVFSVEDIKRVFDSITVKPEWLRIRNCLIVALMYDSGLRQAEVCNLMYKDINYYEHIILVHGKGNKERFVPLGDMTIQLLSDYTKLCPYTNAYVFSNRDGSQITTNTVKHFINRLKNDTGLENLTSHKLRHNFATNFCIDMIKKEGFVDIYKLSALLGHEEVETTKVYLHLAEKLLATNGFSSHLDSVYK